MMKERMKHFKFYYCVLAVLFLFVLVPGRAEASGYTQVNLYDGGRTKVGSYYFWGKPASNGREYTVYVSRSPSDQKGTAIAKTGLYEGVACVFTDGKQVLYSARESSSKSSLCSVSIKGKNKKKYDTVKGTSEPFFMLDCLGGKVYYLRNNGTYSSFCIVSTGTKKKTILVKNIDSFSESENRRYFYLSTCTEKKFTGLIYDRKKNKIIESYSMKKAASEGVTFYPQVTAQYSYLLLSNFDSPEYVSCKIYRCSTSNGKKTVKFVTGLTCASLKELFVKENGIYYTFYDTKKSRTLYYKYSFASKTSKKISASAYNKVYNENGV